VRTPEARNQPRAAHGDIAGDYDRLGFVVLPDLLDRAAIEAARAEATAICQGRRGAVDGLQPADGADEEEEEEEEEEEVLRRYLCIHFPHKLSATVLELARVPAAVDALTTVIGPNVKLVQSMLFIKAAGKPGQAWHQDEAHIPTRDRSLTAIWIALDDATIDNGCLWVLPGSHRRGLLHPVRAHHDHRFDHTPEAHGFESEDDDGEPVELTAGNALVFNGYLLHRSLPNTRSTGLRRALVFHYMSAESLLPWFPPGPGDTMATLDHRDVVLVAGHDPRAAKGTTDVVRPYVRPDTAGPADVPQPIVF